MIRFKQFLNEVQTLNKGELEKHGGYRAEIFRKKIKNGEEFTVDGGSVKIKNTPENLQLFNDIMLGNKPPRSEFELTNGEMLALNKFHKTPEFGGKGSAKILATDWEKAIVVANNINLGMSKEDAIKVGEVDWDPRLDGILDVAFKINESITANSSQMKHYALGTAELTKEWDNYFIKMTGNKALASTKTPKTDMYNNNTRISLKKAGGSQLMSGGQAESLATLMFAYENTPESIKDASFEKAFSNLVQDITDNFKKYNDVSIANIKKDIKAGKKSELINTIKTQLENNKNMTDALLDLTSNEEFKNELVREAMTGNNKFADDLPKCTHVLVFNEIGDASFKLIDDSVVSKYASNTRFDISMKSAGGRSWVAMKGIVKESTNNANEILENTLQETLDEMQLNEGFLDVINKKSKELGIFILNIIKKWFQKIFNVIKTSLSDACDLLNIKIKVNNPTINYKV